MTRLVLALWVLFAAPALAADPPPTDDPALTGPAVIEFAVPGTPPPPDQIDAVTRKIALGLRCPVCQGLSVADSTASTAVLMNNRIRAFVEAGYSRADIDAYFVSKYGEWVLLDPTSEGLNQIVWIGPGLAFFLGLGLAATFLRREPDAVEGAVPAVTTRSDDPYAQALLAEVDDE